MRQVPETVGDHRRRRADHQQGDAVGDTWVTDIRHFLGEDGQLPPLPGPALNLVLFLGSIVEWITSEPMVSAPERTNVRCRRSPGRLRCTDSIVARFEGKGMAIRWTCPRC